MDATKCILGLRDYFRAHFTVAPQPPPRLLEADNERIAVHMIRSLMRDGSKIKLFSLDLGLAHLPVC